MRIAALGYWALGTPVAYLLAFRTGLGATGVWIGLSAGLAATAIMLAGRVRGRLWRHT
jgi:MATE family multidrug resistance protein